MDKPLHFWLRGSSLFGQPDCPAGLGQALFRCLGLRLHLREGWEHPVPLWFCFIAFFIGCITTLAVGRLRWLCRARIEICSIDLVVEEKDASAGRPCTLALTEWAAAGRSEQESIRVSDTRRSSLHRLRRGGGTPA